MYCATVDGLCAVYPLVGVLTRNATLEAIVDLARDSCQEIGNARNAPHDTASGTAATEQPEQLED